MTFKDAVDGTPDLKGSWLPGFQALWKADKEHVSAEDNRRITGSVNIDAALKDRCPHDNRWDYAIGHQPVNAQSEMIYCLEVHPASSGEVKVVLAKVAWLVRWLKESAPKLQGMKKVFVWVSSGKTSFTLSSPQRKQFALHGLRHTGRVFTIPNEAFA